MYASPIKNFEYVRIRLVHIVRNGSKFSFVYESDSKLIKKKTRVKSYLIIFIQISYFLISIVFN